jgi:hypothetical protein
MIKIRIDSAAKFPEHPKSMKWILPALLGLLFLAAPTAVQAQFGYMTNAGGTLTITNYTGAGGVVTIPTNINGLLVTSIGTNAFDGLTNLTSVTITNGLTSIGDSAFESCANLTNVTIPGTVTNIGDSAFAITNGSLTNVYFYGNAPTVGPNVFFGDTDAKVYYPSGGTGWSNPFAGLPAEAWNPPIQLGSLQVTIAPDAAITAGAQWQVDDGASQISGTTLTNLVAGNHTVSFIPISGWNTPTNQTVTITNGATRAFQ